MNTFNNDITKLFLKEFDKYWTKMLESINCKQAQLIQGNRLRPQICLWGYLATQYPLDNKNTFSQIASVSVSIEMIHKASIILDDWIDADCKRHGMPTFHTEHSPQDAVIIALTIIGLSLQRLKQTIPTDSINMPYHYFLCLDVLIDTICSMANGVLKEIRMNEYNIYNLKIITDIAQLETSEIIGNSMIIGYYTGLANEHPNANVVEKFKKIGDMCGYMFQAMNDLEVFSNPQKLYKHKGNFNSDVKQNRKNIAIATLYNIANQRDKQLLIKDLKNNMQPLMKKYNILEVMTYQLNDLFLQLKKNVICLQNEDITSEWIDGFLSFLDYIKAFGEDQLKQ